MPTNVAYILGVLSAIAATILAYIFIIPEKRANRLNKFFYFLHNVFNFKTLLIEKILKGLYVFATMAVVCIGFFMLFSVVEIGRYSSWMGLYGLIMIIVGPIAVRLSYEFIMMFILLVNNVIAIRSKLTDNKNDTPEKKEEKHIPNYVFCTQCGTRYDENASPCPKCGAKNN